MQTLRIGLVACCERKASGPCRARQLYQSDLFKKSLALSETVNDHTFILSGKYGLLEPDDLVEAYDDRLSKTDAKAWGARVAASLLPLFAAADPLTAITLTIYAGADYVAPVVDAVSTLPWPVRFALPLKGMPIGRRLQWLKGRLAAAADEETVFRGWPSDEKARAFWDAIPWVGGGR